MKILRHPVRSIREPFGTAGLIVAMIALVAALGGTALAAAKLNSTQKKEVEKIAKKFAGKPGANGTNGTNGTAGAKGDAGAAGTNGTNGATGAAGESVTVAAASNVECPSGGGTKFSNKTGSGKACNGSPWTAGGTLPKGATESGDWGTAGVAGPVFGGILKAVISPISFNIPLKEAPQVVIVAPPTAEEKAHEEFPAAPAGCTGNASEPGAEEGKLCIFTFETANVPGLFEEAIEAHHFEYPGVLHSGLVPGAGKEGTQIWVHPLVEAEPTGAAGTWAVTGK